MATATSSRVENKNQPPIKLGSWNFYFIAKFFLFWKGLIGFHALENLAFAAFLLLPVRSTALRRLRAVIAVPVAIALLYRDSWLPPLGRVLSQASLVATFSGDYLIELLGRFVSWPLIAALIIAWAVYALIATRIRVGVIVMCALIVLAVREDGSAVATNAVASHISGAFMTNGSPQVSGPDAALQAFYAHEAEQSISFPSFGKSSVPFDIVFIHICSLSWDDLRAMGLENHPLWKRFDLLLTRFNSASSYSGPAAIRIQRATCGQAPHNALYASAPEHCYLMSSLQQSGFEPNLVLNHDGHFDNFLNLVQTQGHLKANPMPLNGLTITQRAFDESPVYDDFAVLSRWADQRNKDSSARVAAYYNTVSLHDGNRMPGAEKGNSLATYKPRLRQLLDDLDRFMEKMERSGRRALVVVVPEHGAAIRGDAVQIAGLREIPSPTVTLVPVGIKVMGSDVHRDGAQVQVDTPTSFLAVSHVIARMMEESPFGPGPFAPKSYAEGIPTTPFVAENEGVVLMQLGERYYLRQGNDGWIDYPVQPASTAISPVN